MEPADFDRFLVATIKAVHVAPSEEANWTKQWSSAVGCIEQVGYVVVPRRDPDLLRAETIRAIMPVVFLGAFMAPMGAFLTAFISVSRGHTSPLVMAIPGLGAGFLFFFLMRLALALKRFASPTRSQTAAMAMGPVAGTLANDNPVTALTEEFERRRQMAASLAHLLRETDPTKEQP